MKYITSFKDAPPDQEGSTYVSHTYFKGNPKPLIGWSKKEEYPEKNDKKHLLTNWLIRLHRSGYLDPAHSVCKEVERVQFLINRSNKVIMTVRPLFTDYHSDLIENERYKSLRQWMNEFHILIRKGATNRTITEALYNGKIQIVNDLSLTRAKFADYDSLLLACQYYMGERRHEPSAIRHFFREYSIKYFDIDPPESAMP